MLPPATADGDDHGMHSMILSWPKDGRKHVTNCRPYISAYTIFLFPDPDGFFHLSCTVVPFPVHYFGGGISYWIHSISGFTDNSPSSVEGKASSVQEKHTHQYLNFQSYHPTQHKESVVSTLMGRRMNLVSSVEDYLVEDRHIITSLETCGYPKWIFNKVVTTSTKRERRIVRAASDTEQKTCGYIVMETVNIFWKYGMSTAMKPFKTLRQILVHPKGKGQTQYRRHWRMCVQDTMSQLW